MQQWKTALSGTGWHRFAFVVDSGSNTVEIYINGVSREVTYYRQEKPIDSRLSDTIADSEEPVTK